MDLTTTTALRAGSMPCAHEKEKATREDETGQNEGSDFGGGGGGGGGAPLKRIASAHMQLLGHYNNRL